MKKTNSNIRVLLCPLDWGLGHATRCVPIVRELLRQGCEVILGTTGIQEHFFRTEFPALEQVACPSYKILYPEKGWHMPFWLLREAPRLRQVIRAEQLWTEKVVNSHAINLVISDNRFGCYSHKVPSLYITHQMRIAFPPMFRRLERLGERYHNLLQKPFAQVWIPDLAGEENLGGRLSHSKIDAKKHFFVGPLTRFAAKRASENAIAQDIDLLALISGPEPQRSLFESKIQLVCAEYPGSTVLVQGKPGHTASEPVNAKQKIYAHLPSEELRQLILRSKLVLCRSGYSTLMDLQALGAKAVLVPTPGQTEQEYLAESLRHKGFCGSMLQEKLNLVNLLAESKHAQGFQTGHSSENLLETAVTQALSLI